MIKISNIAIIDTGYLTTARTGTPSSYKVNSGSAIVMKSATLNYEAGTSFDADPVISTNTGPATNRGTVSAGKITVTGILDRLVSGDMTQMMQLKDLARTPGVKLLYYSSTTDGYRDVTDSLGIADVFGTNNSTDVHTQAGNEFNGTTTPHLHVNVTFFRVSQGPGTQLRFTLEMVETL